MKLEVGGGVSSEVMCEVKREVRKVEVKCK